MKWQNTTIIALLVVAVLACLLVPRVLEPYTVRSGSQTWISTNFSDSGSGVTGVPFNIYPITWKGKKIFPAAVHERDAGSYLYKIMKVSLPGKKDAYVHIIDVCNKCDGPCRSSVEIAGKKYQKSRYRLLDIHTRAFDSDGFGGAPINSYNPSVKIVGVLRLQDIPKLPGGWYVTGCKSGERRVNCGNRSQAQDFGSYCSWTERK